MNIKDLNAEIARQDLSVPKLADKLGVSKKTLYSRFKGETSFKQDEIYEISKVLKLNKDKIFKIFFT